MRQGGLVVIAAAIVAGCGTSAPSPSVGPPSAPAPSSSPSPTTVASASGQVSPSGAVAADPSLLEALPENVGGLVLQYAPEATTETAADPELAESAEAIAYAVAIDPETSDLVVAAVTRPRPGLFDDAFFRDWRDSFDGSVCDRAGGVRGHAQTEVDGRPVFIATCAEGAAVYHTYLERRGVIVSISSVGDSRLGEQLMDQLSD